MSYTPLLENAPRVLIHARGSMSLPDTAFWQRVRFALRKRDYELMLTGYHRPKQFTDVPFLKAPNGVSLVQQIPYDKGWEAWLPQPKLDYDEEQLLEREELWHGPPADRNVLNQRVHAMRMFYQFYAAAVKAAQPVFSIVWNGYHPQEMLLSQICQKYGCPVHYIERGPFHGTIQVDATDILGGTAIARATDWQWAQSDDVEKWHDIAVNAEKEYAEQRSTWWDQPSSVGPERLRKKLGIRPEDTVVLFAGQVDDDTQNFMFSPNFENNLEAFEWFCASVSDKKNLFILGKHHPKAKYAPEQFQETVAGKGVWLDEASLEDCLSIADRVAGVNSTVLYEALMMNKPVLCMGECLLSGKGIAYEIQSLESGTEAVDAFLTADDFEDRKRRWIDFGANLFAHHIYTMNPEEENPGQRGAEEFADYLIEHAVKKGETRYDELHLEHGFVDAIGAWDDARIKVWIFENEHTGIREVLRGLNIILKATLGRFFPSLYQSILKLARNAYDGREP